KSKDMLQCFLWGCGRNTRLCHNLKVFIADCTNKLRASSLDATVILHFFPPSRNAFSNTKIRIYFYSYPVYQTSEKVARLFSWKSRKIMGKNVFLRRFNSVLKL